MATSSNDYILFYVEDKRKVTAAVSAGDGEKILVRTTGKSYNFRKRFYKRRNRFMNYQKELDKLL